LRNKSSVDIKYLCDLKMNILLFKYKGEFEFCAVTAAEGIILSLFMSNEQ